MSRTNPRTLDIHPRSHPEDRQEGNFNPDPNLECWTCASADAEPAGGNSARQVLAVHGPSGEAGDDDGAGNPSPRQEEVRYGQDDADQGHMGAT